MSRNWHFDFLAPFYDRAIPPPEPERLARLLRLPIAGALLEAGGGTGRVAARLAGQVGQLVVSDLSAQMLAEVRAKALCCPVQARVERLPFPDGFFDRVLVVDALHHFSDQPGGIADLVRVLKPGGRLVIEEPDIERSQVKLIALAEKLALMGSHFHSPEAIRDMLAAHGLSAIIERDELITAWVVADK